MTSTDAHAHTPPTDPRVAAEVARCGSLDAAITQLAHDACGSEWGSPVHAVYRAALAERSARKRLTETPDEKAFRLGLQAADKDVEAGGHFEAATEAAGLAAGRRLRGLDDGVAAMCDREAAACTKLGQKAQAEAERLRSEAAAIRRSQRAEERTQRLREGF